MYCKVPLSRDPEKGTISNVYISYIISYHSHPTSPLVRDQLLGGWYRLVERMAALRACAPSRCDIYMLTGTAVGARDGLAGVRGKSFLCGSDF